MKKTMIALSLFLPVVLCAQDTKTVEPRKEMKQTSIQEAQASAEVKADASQKKMHGYVVDAMCAKGMMKNSETSMKKAMAHSKECALEDQCASSGFGLMSEGKWYKFDEKGDMLAKESITSSKSEKGLMYEVTGTIEGDKLAVTSLKEKMADKTGKKSGMKEEESSHKH